MPHHKASAERSSPPSVRFFARSDKGLVRAQNEDRWSAESDSGLFVVADGMGGHRAGAFAAKLATEVLPGLLLERLSAWRHRSDDAIAHLVSEVLEEFNRKLLAHGARRPERFGLGTTLAMVLVDEQEAVAIHVGDSRIYQLRDGALTQLTRDHSLVQYLIDTGELDVEAARSHPARGRLVQYLGMSGVPKPDVRRFGLSAGDRLLLCSDGLTDLVSDEQLAPLLATYESAQACDVLVEAALAAGGTDNVTALVVVA